MLVYVALSLVLADPGGSAESAPAAEAAEVQVCKSQVTTGTLVPQVVCKPLAQWREEERSDDLDEVELVENFGVRRLNSWED